MFDDAILSPARDVLRRCEALGLKLATAESCTGGLVASALTAIAGSSRVVERGFVSYSNEAKAELLGVPPALIVKHGAVSAHVARAMADGALARSAAGIAVSLTGVAGPDGGTDAKPVGLVYIGCARRGHETAVERHQFPGDRDAVRQASVIAALTLVLRQLG
jgi:nicotinamide-nucleotide amidase